MRPSSEAIKSSVSHQMNPAHRQSVEKLALELSIHVMTRDEWWKGWLQYGEFMTAELKDTELGAYRRRQNLVPEQVDRWHQASQDANAQPRLTMSVQEDLEKRSSRIIGGSGGCDKSDSQRALKSSPLLWAAKNRGPLWRGRRLLH